MKGGFYTNLFLLVCLSLFSFLPNAIAQDGTNPFDLQHRLSKQKIEVDSSDLTDQNPFDIESRKTTETEAKAPEETSPSAKENPFDINRVNSNKRSQEVSSKPPIVNPAVEIVQESKDTRNRLLFWPILVMMIILALLVTLYRSLIGKIYRAFTNENILKLLQREQGTFISFPYLFLYVLFFASAGIFVFQLGYYYQALSFDLMNLGYCILGVCIVFLLKHLILKIIEIVFPISKEIKLYNFTIIIFSIILGILLIPFNIFVAFAQESLTYTGIIGGFIAIGTVYLFRSLRGFFIGSKFLAFHKFHFFMYLCAVEIAPVLILTKLLLNGASVH